MLTIALVLALTLTADPVEPPAPLFEAGIIVQSGYLPLLTIAGDGAWWAGGHGGKLTSEELERIDQGARTMILRVSDGPPCPTLPVRQVVRVPRGEVIFAFGCGVQPHPSVLALRGLADAFTVQSATAPLPSTVLVRLDRWLPGHVARKESIILKRNGEWTADNGVGTIGGEELVRIAEAFDGAVLEVKPPAVDPSCKGELWYDAELPGRGRLIWSSPCQSVSSTLQVALGKLLAVAASIPPPR